MRNARLCRDMCTGASLGVGDNIRFDRVRLAASNAESVASMTEACAEFGRHAAAPAETRALLRLGGA